MLSRDEMVERMLANDHDTDGQFIVAVKTTGIYCLPSCRPARKPKPENVVFYATPEEARGAGYRACKLCHPDDFYAGHHAEESLIESLVAGVVRDPGAYHGVGQLAACAGMSVSKLHALVRTYYHTTPGDLLARARVYAARRALLAGRRQVAEIAFAVGFASLSSFNENFRKYSALSPLEYRRMRDQSVFVLALPANYPIARMLRSLGRDRHRLTERVIGQTYTTLFHCGEDEDTGCLAVVCVEFAPGHARCTIEVPMPLGPLALERLHERIMRTLGLTYDPTRFEAQIAARATFAPLLDGQYGLRVLLIAELFDAVVWSIVGQQVTRTLAATFRQRLIMRSGVGRVGALYACPLPGPIAALDPAELVTLGLGRAKADYLIGAARAIVGGKLPLAATMGKSVPHIERSLRDMHGIGPWSAHYVLMRHYGFLDCVPLGDTGLTTSLQHFFDLAARPGKRQTSTLMASFSPYRSLATFHFWQRLERAA